ncbi:MAG TPA: hypothetical protein VE090_02455 [Methylomirabilota bacterium]|nr:hypothetical protein [Methylomirabilota bacterium]
MFKKRTIQIVVGVVLVVLVAGGGYFYLANKSKAKPQEDQSQSQDIVQKLSPDAIGLTLTSKPDNKSVKFAIAKISGIKSIEYELTYEADSTAQEQSEGGEARVQRGITGQAQINGSDSTYESPWLDLGSCSRNVCHYDTGVKSVDLTLKIIKIDGKTYEVEKTLDL